MIVFGTCNSLPASPKECEYQAEDNLLPIESEYVECPDDSFGDYPNCTCLHKDFIFNMYFNRCATVCPQNSTGSWPYCICDEGGNGTGHEIEYDKINNSCHKRECPTDDSAGIYPNCMCNENLDYKVDQNRCVPFCSADSTGEWPNCICDEGYEFEFGLDSLSCKKTECPDGDSTRIYPNCTCVHKSFDYSFPFNRCVAECSADSTGEWPDCVCDEGYEYDFDSSSCTNSECPDGDSTGIYPNCTYVHKNFDYSFHLYRCFRVCPEEC